MEQYVWISKLIDHPVVVNHVDPVLTRIRDLYKVEVVKAGPQDTATEPYVQAIYDAISRKVAGIMVVGWGDDGVVEAINSACDQGVPVVTVDSDVPQSRRLAHVGTDWFRMGGDMADKTAQLMGGYGKVLMISMAGTANMQAGFHGFRARMNEYPDIQIFGPADDLDSGCDQGEEFVTRHLAEHPDLSSVVGFDGNSGRGAAMALKRAGKEHDVRLVCVDADADQVKHIRSGVIDAVFYQRRGAFTFQAFQMLYSYNHGTPVTSYKPGKINMPGNIDTGTVVVTSDNVDTFKNELDIEESFSVHEQCQEVDLLSKLFENVSEIVLAMDTAGRVVAINPAGLGQLGYNEEEVEQLELDQVFQLTGEHRNDIETVWQQGMPVKFTSAAVRKDGTTFPVQLSLTSLRTNSAPLSLIAIGVDITDRKPVEESLRESQALLQSTIESLPFDFFAIGRDGRYIMQNSVCREHWGDVVGKKPEDVVADRRNISLWLDNNRRAFSGETVDEEVEFLVRGEKGYFHNIISPIRDGDRILGILGVNLDITDHKRAEDSIREREERYTAIFEGAGEGIIYADRSGTVLEVNQSFQEITGISKGEVVGKKATVLARKLLTPKQLPRMLKIIKHVLSGKAVNSYELEFKCKILEISVPLKMEVTGVTSIIKDITERKRAEKVLRDGERYFRSLLNNMHESIMVIDREFRITDVNETFVADTGYQREDAIGRRCYEIFHGIDVPCSEVGVDCQLHKVFSYGKAQSCLHVHKKADGSMSHYDILLSPLRGSDGKVQQVIEASRDVTDLVKAQEALRESEEYFRALIENSLDVIMLLGEDGRIKYATPSLKRILGYDFSEATDTDVFQYLHPDDSVRIEKLFKKTMRHSGATNSFQVRVRNKNGSWVFVEGTGVNLLHVPSIEGAIINWRDVTEPKRAEEALKDSEQRFRQIAENVGEALILSDASDNSVIYASPAYEEIWGHSVETLYTNPQFWQKAIHPEDRQRVKRVLDKHDRGKREFRNEYRIVRPDGSIRWVYDRVFPIRNESGDIYRIVGVSEDITDRKRAEETVKLERDKLQTLVAGLAGVGIGIDIVGLDYKVLFQNKLLIKTFGDIGGKVCYEHYMGLKEPCNFCPMIKAIESQNVQRAELTSVNGRMYELLSAPFPNPDGTTDKAIEVIIDITERKRAEELQDAVYRISQAVDSSESLDALYREVHEIIRGVMPAENFYIALWDEKEDLLTFPYFIDKAEDAAPPRKRGKGMTEYVLRTGKSLLCDTDFKEELERRGGAEFVGEHPLIWLGVPLMVEKKTIGVMTVQHYSDPKAYGERELHMLEYVSAQVAKAIEHKRAEEALRASEELNRGIITHAPMGMIYLDADGRILYMNRHMERILGVPDDQTTPNIGKRIQDIPNVAEAGGREIWHRIRSGEEINGVEFEYHSMFGAHKLLELHAAPRLDASGAILGAILMCEDITDYKEMEMQLRHAQKMEAVGRLAGGIAHDFNNLLTAITGHSDLALMSLDVNDPLRGDVEEIQNAAHRAADLTRQLLAFSRKQTLKPRVLDLNLVIIEMDKMLRRIIGEDIEMLTVTGDNLWKVKVDPGQLEQVIINLVVNACDAMPNGGKLTIETANVKLDKSNVRIHPDILPGKYVMISVSDTGVGMSREIESQIFEPFFTTKEASRGTGLGLSTIYGIVTQSEGHITVDSVVGKGSTFKIYFPRVRAVAEEIAPKPEMSQMPRGTESILVVEDERTVRELTVRTLRKLGYDVVDAQGGGEAYVMCEKMEEPVDLIITDVVMPKMGGAEFVSRVRKFWPDIKVMYMSGYAFNGIVKNGTLSADIPYLRKPFRLGDLAQKVRQVLDK